MNGFSTKKIVRVIVSALFLCGPVFALDIPDKPSSYVNDTIQLLSSSARSRLEATLAAFEKETSNQVVVAIFGSLEGGSLEDFSIRLAEKWKIGSEKNDNGVILLIFKEDRAVRIEVGYGLEGALPDATARLIIQNEIVPAFRAGDFDGGVEKAVAAIQQATQGEYKATGSSSQNNSVDAFMEKNGWVFYLGMFLFFLVPYLLYALIFITGYIFGGIAGLGIAAVIVAVLEIIRRLLPAISHGTTYSGRGSSGGWSSGGFGGGFSGGGGSFGGGGSSGSW